MARGIERRNIFVDDLDRCALVRRIAQLVKEGAWEVFAWALMPNHLHLLVETKSDTLSHAMRRLLTGHALYFNRRHDRVGHLFQNRYRSVLCDGETYFLTLVRYIHLNPLRGKLVATLRDLDEYPFTGHSALVGVQDRPWQSTARILERFARDRRRAVSAYRAFVGNGDAYEKRPDLLGGGLIRSAGGWEAVKDLRRAREAFEFDERILGKPKFVRAILSEVRNGAAPPRTSIDLTDLVARVCRAAGLEPAEWSPRCKRPRVSKAKDGVAFLWICRLRKSGKQLAREWGLHPASVYRACERGWRDATRWDRVLGENR